MDSGLLDAKHTDTAHRTAHKVALYSGVRGDWATGAGEEGGAQGWGQNSQTDNPHPAGQGRWCARAPSYLPGVAPEPGADPDVRPRPAGRALSCSCDTRRISEEIPRAADREGERKTAVLERSFHHRPP